MQINNILQLQCGMDLNRIKTLLLGMILFELRAFMNNKNILFVTYVTNRRLYIKKIIKQRSLKIVY